MSAEENSFKLEYVTGGIQLPPWGTSASETFFTNISVVNVGDTPAAVRAFGLRGLGTPGIQAADQVFDSDLNPDTMLGPFTGHVQPGQTWLYAWTLIGGGEPVFAKFNMYWFRILTTSQDLIPSIEIVSQNSPTPQLSDPPDHPPFLEYFSVVARYTAGDFSVLDRRARILPAPPVAGPIRSE